MRELFFGGGILILQVKEVWGEVKIYVTKAKLLALHFKMLEQKLDFLICKRVRVYNIKLRIKTEHDYSVITFISPQDDKQKFSGMD